MPKRPCSEDSSSSSSSKRSSSRRQRAGKRRKVTYGSSCGIRSMNEYHDRLINKDVKKAEAYVETGDESKAWAGASATDHENGHFSCDARAGAAALEKDNHTAGRARADASAEFGLGGVIAEANADATAYSYGDDSGQIDVGKGRVGGGVGLGAGGAKAKVEAGVDVVDLKVKFSKNRGMDANLGLNADTGFEAGVDGVSASALGFGFSLGRNSGISTPLGRISFKLW